MAASLSDDQLDECREKLFEADKLVADAPDPHWVGKNVIRGVTTLMGGVIQCMQHSFVKGVWNVLSSWKYISCLEAEALHYEGLERESVRSSALLTLAIFNLLVSVLPPAMMKTAQWLSGFQGDRAQALVMLQECYKEGGILAPWAAVILCAYQIDVKTFLGEPQSEEDFAQCEGIIQWADERYPGSIFFRGLEADLMAARKNVRRASELSAAIDAEVGELKAMR